MRFATDENFKGSILKGLITRLPDLDIVRVQDTEMYQSPDPELLEWLAQEQRILLTHDVQTMPDHVYERIRQNKVVIGIIVVQQNTLIGQALVP